MHRKHFILFLATGFSVFLTLPFINLISRSVAQVDPSVLDSTEKFWSTDLLEGLRALALWQCCNHSLQPGQAVIGDKGYLFLGNDYNGVIDKTTGRFTATQETIDAWVEGLESLASYAGDIGADFLFVLAPNKHTIYPDHLPKHVIPAEQTVTDQVIASIEQRALPLLDFRQPLRALRSETQAYMLTDTHWTHSGAALAYTEIMSHLNDITNRDLTPLKFEQTPSRRPSGDLALFLKVRPFLGPRHEMGYNNQFQVGRFCVAKQQLDAETAEACDENAGLEVDVTNRPFFTKSQVDDAPNKQTVVMICDSFCTAHSALFNASFQTVYRIHWSYLQGDMLQERLARLKPDILIYHLVERNLLDPQLTLD